MATSGPGAIHLLNGLYDAKLDHVPVVAIVGQTARSAMGGHYQQEVDLLSLFKDVASDYLVRWSPCRASCPTCWTGRSAPPGAPAPHGASSFPPTSRRSRTRRRATPFKMVPSSLGVRWPSVRAPETLRSAHRRDPERRLESRHPDRPGRARRPRGDRGGRRAARRPAWRRRCWARTSCPTTCRRSQARSACWAPGRATR